MNLNVAICDDEPIICKEIKRLLLKFKPDCTVDIFLSGLELLSGKKAYDLIFLDIEMPGIDGMKTAETLRNNQRKEYIIFLTSHAECMPDAFKVRAFRFLNKPIEEHAFKEAVLTVAEDLLNNAKLPVTILGTTTFLNREDIICFEAFGDGTYIYITSGEVLETNKPLRYWISEVGPEHFYQTHKSYLVSLRHVKTIESKYVLMNSLTQPIPISRRQHTDFKEAFFTYIKNNARYL